MQSLQDGKDLLTGSPNPEGQPHHVCPLTGSGRIAGILPDSIQGESDHLNSRINQVAVPLLELFQFSQTGSTPARPA